MTDTITNHEQNKRMLFSRSKHCARRINDFWAEHGIDARAEVLPNGEIASRIDVTRHIPHADR